MSYQAKGKYAHQLNDKISFVQYEDIKVKVMGFDEDFSCAPPSPSSTSTGKKKKTLSVRI